jgi:HPt (histidine-containing phosphotransfer) domain-containing protein
MDELRDLYRQTLPGRIAALEAARREADDADDAGDEATLAIRRIAHALRGSGGTYGFPAITAAAAAVEDAATHELPARLDALLELLREAAAS